MDKRADRVRVGDLLVSLKHPGTRVAAVDRVDGGVQLTVRRPTGETVKRQPVPPDWPVDIWPAEEEDDGQGPTDDPDDDQVDWTDLHGWQGARDA
jgi:hypothetical protein